MLVVFIYNGLTELPLSYGKWAQLQQKIAQKFIQASSEAGFNLIDFPEIMPLNLVDTKFVNEDWLIQKPNSSERFVLTPEITALYASLLGENAKNEQLRRISYVSTCYRENRFKQLGIEAIGAEPLEDIAVIKFSSNFLRELGLEGEFSLALNDLSWLRKEILKRGVLPGQEDSVLKALDNYDCRKRKNESQALTLLEENLRSYSLDSQTQKLLLDLVQSDIVENESLEFKSIREEIQKDVFCQVSPFLARGLSYYNSLTPRTSAPIFEIYSRVDQTQICGGGRYDGLMGRLNPGIQGTVLDYGVGFAFGLERLSEVVVTRYGTLEEALEGLR